MKNLPGAHHVAEELSEAECWDLLGGQLVGRFAFLSGNRIEVFPVNYVVDDGVVYFRTASNGAIERAMPRDSASFQIDAFDPAHAAGWSVLVSGRAERILDPARLVELFRLPMEQPWAGGLRVAFIAVRPVTVTGRRVHMKI